MASERALALRRALVEERLAAAAARIAPSAPARPRSKDPVIAGIERLEALADLLETPPPGVGPITLGNVPVTVTVPLPPAPKARH